MYVSSGSPKYKCSRCKTRIPVVDLEGIFLDELTGYLLSPEKVAEYVQRANDSISEKVQLLESLRKEHQKCKTEADKVYDMYGTTAITVEQFKERFHPADARKRQIEAEIPRVEAEIDLDRVREISTEQVMAEALDLRSRWPKMTFQERRSIVELLVKSIVISDGEITLNLCYYPSFEETTKRQRILTDSSPQST